MAFLNYQSIPLSFHNLVNPKPCLRFSAVPSFSATTVICGLRRSPRKLLWRSSVLSNEAIQAVQALKLAKSPDKIEQVLNARLGRLLKVDVLDALAELQRQNELDLSLKVFNFIREEAGYKTELSLYCDMILLLGRNKLIDMAEELFSQLSEKGLKLDTRTYTEMIGAYIQVDMTEKAMQIYNLMKASGCRPDKLTFTILIRNFEKAGKQELAETLKKECADYVESAKNFLQELEQKQAKRRSPDLV